MKIKKIWLLIIGLAVTLGVITGVIAAWLTDTDTTPSQTFTVGEVTYEWTAGTFVSGPVVPGQNVIDDPYHLTNTSNVASELRLQITITYPVGGTPTDATSLVTYTLDSNWVLDTGYYYYRAGTADAEGKYPIAAATSVNGITGLALNGALVGNDFVGVVFTVTMTFQAKQNDYVAWSDLGLISFTTGL